MFIGHFAVSLAAKRVTPRVPLLVLFTAALLADLIWPVVVAFGIEHVRIVPGSTAFTPLEFQRYPYSHSLALLIVWGVALGLLYRVVSRQDGPTVVVITGLVVSHWALDFLTHRPDMPLYPRGPKLGLGLWNSIPATITIELLMLAAGVWLYLRATRARDRIGHWAFVGFAVLLLVAYGATAAGPPPPSVEAMAVTAVAGSAVVLLWSMWLDRHRTETLSSRSSVS